MGNDRAGAHAETGATAKSKPESAVLLHFCAKQGFELEVCSEICLVAQNLRLKVSDNIGTWVRKEAVL